MKKYKVIIIGSGPTGLGAAYRLQEGGVEDFLILEQDNRVGGLAGSFVDEQGFTWDIGGHVQFSHYQYFDRLMMELLGEDGWLHHERESWVCMDSRFIPYPFQNNIKYLDRDKLWHCLQGIIHANQQQNSQKPENFYQWILAIFGNGIAEHFMLPYNFKVWAFPPEQMSYQWIGERVAVVDLERVSKNILFDRDDISWGPNHTFQFPKRGGTGAIWQQLADRIVSDNIRLQARVASIDSEKKILTLHSGEILAYDVLFSTMPLDQLTTKIDGLDASMVKAAAGLKHSSSHIIGIGLEGRPSTDLAKKCWLYFPEDNCPFYRVTVFSNYSPYNVPDHNKHWSLMAEVSGSKHKKVDKATLIADTIQGMRNTGLISGKDSIVSRWQFSADYGYPTPSLERDVILEKVIPLLDKKQIFSRGRFGGWKYEVSNQDHALMQGVEWANFFLYGIPEITYFYPHLANSNYAK